MDGCSLKNWKICDRGIFLMVREVNFTEIKINSSNITPYLVFYKIMNLNNDIMKKLVLFFLGLFMASLGYAQITQDTLIILSLQNQQRDIYMGGISPNGRYVTGFTDFQYVSFIWNETTGFHEFGNDGLNSSGVAVSNNGIVAGNFDGKYEMTNGDSVIVTLAGYYSNGMWHLLALDPNTPITEETVSHASSISSDGTVIGGSYHGGTYRHIPTKWHNGLPTALEYTNSGQGADITSLSSNGAIAGGFTAPNNTPFPVIWINGEMIPVTYNGIPFPGTVNGISSNGKYAAVYCNDLPAIYDIEEDRLTFLGKKEGALVAEGIAVTDDGILVGINVINPLDFEPFIYTPQLGMMDLTDYLESIGITIPAGLVMTEPTGISADGSRIVGKGTMNNYGIGWIINIENPLQGLNRPGNLSLMENNKGNITLSWNAAEPDAGQTLTGYNVYRNDVKLNSTPVTATTYHDPSLTTGNYNYYITAVWGSEESIPSDRIKYNVGSMEIPFMENFSTGSLDTNYWNLPTDMTRWKISAQDGLRPPALEFTVPVYASYRDTILSPYMEGNGHQEILLAYNIAIPVMGNITGDTMKVEIFDGNNWQLIKEHHTKRNGSFTFQYEEIDISNWTSDREFRIRFIGVGTNRGEFPLWFIDNIYIYTPEDALVPEAPISLTAHQSENDWVYLNWADHNEVAQLSYLEFTESTFGISNLGEPFIAANKYTAQDLASYEGYYLTSISVIMSRIESFMPACTLYVSQGGERKVSQPIGQFTPQSWNTFELQTPYLIDHTQDLYYGIEVGQHASSDLIIGLCDPVMGENGDEPFNIYDGRSNLYSEDNARTWNKLSDADLIGSLGITGILKKDVSTVQDGRILGYKIYRNGVSLLGSEGGGDILTIINNYTDYRPLNSRACYEITAYYDTQEESPRSESFCFTTTDIIENEVPGLLVYPNPVHDHINIVVPFIDATLFDLQGNMILNSNEPQINVNGITPGIYFLRINLLDGRNTTRKIIKM